MKISPTISFGKTLVATCQINTTDNDNSECKIFELSNKEDRDYFEKLKKDKHWTGNKYLWSMDNLMQSGSIGNNNDTFSLENSNGECLGYINVITHEAPYNRKFIYSIETAPDFSAKKKDRTIKNIGRSLVAFVVAQAKQENKEQVRTLAFDSDTRTFFKRHCGFKYGQLSSFDCVLEKKYYSNFLEKFKDKTGSEIKFIT